MMLEVDLKLVTITEDIKKAIPSVCAGTLAVLNRPFDHVSQIPEPWQGHAVVRIGGVSQDRFYSPSLSGGSAWRLHAGHI